MSEKIKANLLIVDDETAIRSTLARILQGSGCAVTTAASGAEALRRLEGDPAPFDLAILDLRMPDMNGIDLLREIRKMLPRLPVILLTGHGSLSTAMDALQLGAVDYLLKPVNPDTLIERTQKVLLKTDLERKRSSLQEQIFRLQTELNQIEQILADYTPLPDSDLAHTLSLPAEPGSSRQNRYINVGNLNIDLQARRVSVRHASDRLLPLDLRPSSFDYLVVLARHIPDTISYQDLVAEAQGYQASVAEARELAKWHIHHLRQTVAQIPGIPIQIINVRGIGYRLVVD